MTNDGCKLALDTWGILLTTFQAVYTKLMNTWNALPAAYREKVTTTITAELCKQVIDTKPTNGTLQVLDDTSPEEIDADMMSPLLAEPLPVVPPYQQMQIPLAVNEKLIDTEDVIIPDDATIGEDTGDVLFNGYGPMRLGRVRRMKMWGRTRSLEIRGRMKSLEMWGRMGLGMRAIHSKYRINYDTTGAVYACVKVGKRTPA